MNMVEQMLDTASLRTKKKQRTQQARRYGFACSNCRRKKARCNGATPACDKCVASRETCEYDRGPSVAYAASLEKRLKAFEERFEKLRQSSAVEDRDALIQEPFEDVKPERARAPLSLTTGLERQDNEAQEHEALSSPSPAPQNEPPVETSIGADGRICFYGKTSHYHVDPQDDGKREDLLPEGDEQQALNMGVSTASAIYTTPELHLFVDAVPQLLSEISAELLDHFLDAYWCWSHHLHLVLNKRLFLRDLYTSGPSVTPFLISAILAQAARYSTRPQASHLGDHFAGRALHLLPNDIDKGSSIPTIQGLLILSARECACGRISQGWLYSGMAFRMMRDLGIHIEPRKMGYLSRQFSEEDLALRQQVFWSCFTWDKTMSLCLGRAPIIHDTIDVPSRESLLDGAETDEEEWVPVLGKETDSTPSFIEQKSLGSARFAAYCRLCTIIDGVLDGLYCRPHQSRRDHLLAFLDSTIRKLEQWSTSLPRGLFMSPDSRVVLCPPIHILLLNLTYHATVILLCRPYRNISLQAKELCTKAAQMIDTLFTLHVRRFGFRFITYLQTYTMFVACTINVLDLKENESNSRDANGTASREKCFALAQEASVRLNFGLEVLRQAGATPSAARCAAVIVQLLRQWSNKQVESTVRSQRQRRPSEHISSPHSRRQASICLPQAGNVSHGNVAGSGHPNQSFQHNAHFRNDLLPTSTPGGAGDNVLFPALESTPAYAQAHGQTINAQSSPDMSNPMTLGFGSSGGLQSLRSSNSPYANAHMPNFANPGIETPMRWLPDNIQDDGSWMLMMDFGDTVSL
ncbi:uncharacterized protein A1O5_00594 [Cladophialophora psammophila CBS 110553]|uniref:Zn(2)-C6 fungal-type domain-containing protein n=1 Tax=Cladophialophora psammophila CBS 110553 TaxID=1182543 RepID=W9XGK6_9EURO|nr:uncharacterized protein A1O5_00594 [Cladophialophora psammophila CBS 110553]EXJ76086.1 hypothetical protein A1O5_00594 [Cladophialophora psammophila CBS 110553]